MKTINIFNLTALILFVFIGNLQLKAQDNEKEIIIIEKTVDADGNVISKNIKRNRGTYSEDDIQDMIDDEGDLPSIRSFDLEGMGWGDDFRDMFAPKEKSKPTLGVVLNIENDQLVVKSVADDSGAQSADIRAADKVISVDNLPVSTVEEIQEILAGHDFGDKVKVVIWRDGQEIEKDILLKRNRFEGLLGNGGFEFPEGGIQFFGDIEGMDMDSLFSRFKNMSPDLFDFDGLNLDQLRAPEGSIKTKRNGKIGATSSKRPQLGLFIEDTSEGIIVTEVIDGSAADMAGIQQDDVLTHIDDNMIMSYRELNAWMNTKSIGDDAVITVDRDGKSKDLKVAFK